MTKSTNPRLDAIWNKTSTSCRYSLDGVRHIAILTGDFYRIRPLSDFADLTDDEIENFGKVIA